MDRQVQELEQAVGHQRRQVLSDGCSGKECFEQQLDSAELPVGSNCIFSPQEKST